MLKRQSDKCIVSFASKGRENYLKAILRLARSCALIPWDGDYILRTLDGYVDEYSGIPIINGNYPPPATNNHAEIPYIFKVDACAEAFWDEGYKQVIWCDSTIVMKKYPAETLVHAAKYGVAAFHNFGHDLFRYVSDVAMQAQGLIDAQLYNMPQIMACCIAFDFTNPKGKYIFDEWFKASRDGCSFQNGYGSKREGFISHKHDQAVLSIILAKNNIPLLPYGKLVYQPHDTNGEYGNDFEWCNMGVDVPL